MYTSTSPPQGHRRHRLVHGLRDEAVEVGQEIGRYDGKIVNPEAHARDQGCRQEEHAGRQERIDDGLRQCFLHGRRHLSMRCSQLPQGLTGMIYNRSVNVLTVFCIDVLPQADIHGEVARYREVRSKASRSHRFDFSENSSQDG